ncbi:MAG: hypothetical protein H0V67_02275 [Geodermatophilaceae bacterium]|nr:hypothetical protein [Geodermatophilaceae bacterium]
MPEPSERGRLGDWLEHAGVFVAVRVLWVRDPADDLFAAEGIGVPAGHRSLVVASELTNVAEEDFLAPADRGLVLVDSDGDRHGRATATLTAHPRFRHGPVGSGESVSGHTYFVVPRTATLRQVEWTVAGSDDEPVLTWLL